MARQAAGGSAVRTLIVFGDGHGRDSGRREAADKTAACLGTEAPIFAGFPENRGDTIPLVEIVDAIESNVRDCAATTVLLPSPAALNVDHRTCFEAGATALRPVPGLSVARVLAYEIVSSTNWAPQMHWDVFRPNVYVDIASQLPTKEEALGIYAAEIPDPPHARSVEAVIGLARQRGATVGLAAAEGFELVRELIEGPA